MKAIIMNATTRRNVRAAGTLLAVLGGGWIFTTAQASVASTQPLSHVSAVQHAPHMHKDANSSMNNVDQTPALQATTPSINVANQPVTNAAIVVDEVVALQDGWVVIHTTEAEGHPVVSFNVGKVAIKAGRSTHVSLPLSQLVQPGEQLVAMLHVDEGTRGTFEFPGGADVAVRVGEQVVETPFTVLDPAHASVVLPNTGASHSILRALLAAVLLLGSGIGVHRRYRHAMPEPSDPLRTTAL